MIYPNCTGKQVMGRKSNPRTVRVKTRFTRTTNRLGVQTPLSGSPLGEPPKTKIFPAGPAPRVRGTRFASLRGFENLF